MTSLKIRVAGFGGQGVILSGYVIGKAASIYDKKEATLVQSYGPEAGGEACSAQVIISDTTINYPLVDTPDILIAMSQEGYSKFSASVKKGGVILIDEDLVFPSSTDKRVMKIPATRIAEELGRKIVANMVMLGFFSSQCDAVSVDGMRESIKTSVPKGTEELNLNAFNKGYEYRKHNK
ncbi:MAG: 2-oxoacid:acceptor oxidoreductase family protein [bacterium]|nr:2-oxoacid:acceptor oxidoreductase family protein [bacterium]